MSLLEWDQYYLGICDAVAKNSKCLSRKIGAILVKDKSIIATGYNGPPRGIPHCSCRYSLDPVIKELIKGKSIDANKCPRYNLGYKSGEGLELCVAGHAERNALINAARHGVCVKDSTLYMNANIPCKDCLIELINAGIIEIVITEIKLYDKVSKYLIDSSCLNIRKFEGV